MDRSACNNQMCICDACFPVIISCSTPTFDLLREQRLVSLLTEGRRSAPFNFHENTNRRIEGWDITSQTALTQFRLTFFTLQYNMPLSHPSRSALLTTKAFTENGKLLAIRIVFPGVSEPRLKDLNVPLKVRSLSLDCSGSLSERWWFSRDVAYQRCSHRDVCRRSGWTDSRTCARRLCGNAL